MADARFAKPLDTALIEQLARDHEVLITIEEGAMGGFRLDGAAASGLAGLLDGGLKVRPMVLPDRFIDHDSQPKQLVEAGLTAKDIVAAVLSALGIGEALAGGTGDHGEVAAVGRARPLSVVPGSSSTVACRRMPPARHRGGQAPNTAGLEDAVVDPVSRPSRPAADPMHDETRTAARRARSCFAPCYGGGSAARRPRTAACGSIGWPIALTSNGIRIRTTRCRHRSSVQPIRASLVAGVLN